MAVRIRLARHGRKRVPYYRIVAADSEMPRSGRFLEQLGTLNPLADPPVATLKEERLKYWIGVGALPTSSVSHVVNREMPGFLASLEEGRREKIRARRAKRKERAKAGA